MKTFFAATLIISFFGGICSAKDYNPLKTLPKVKEGLFRKDRFNHCRATGSFEAPKGAYKMFTRKVRSCQVIRQNCLPCGRKTSYCETVTIFRDYFSDGSTRTWTCVHNCPVSAVAAK